VASGTRQWDDELFRIMPVMLSAATNGQANDVLWNWIDSLGPVAKCTICSTLPREKTQLQPALGWIGDKDKLGLRLSRTLKNIYRNRLAGRQFYAGKSAFDSDDSAHFDMEIPYDGSSFPDSGLQLLALYRFWNTIEYWYPYRDVIAEDWDGVLKELIPSFLM